jgi:hypothetical protein
LCICTCKTTAAAFVPSESVEGFIHSDPLAGFGSGKARRH